MRLDGKVAIITGATGGIGAATAHRFAREGARLMLVDRGERALEELAARLGTEVAIHRAADVSSVDDTEAYVRATVDRFGGVDVLFANAGNEGRLAPLVDSAVVDFDRVIAVNLRGV
jgi:NAD(P)-dependent dehydrogenase (short-subunit alcohol dehydrogenase family)